MRLRASALHDGPMPAVLKAVLLDLDDTLLRFSSGCAPAWERTCAAHAPALGLDAQALLRAMKTASAWFWSDEHRHREHRLDMFAARRRVAAHAFRDLGLEPGPSSEALADDYTRLQESMVQLFPGSLPTLAALRARGLALALVTNGGPRAQRAKIERFGLAPSFDVILIEGELGYGKPDPRIFQDALSALSARAAEACMVGDNYRWEIDGAKQLGMRAIWNNIHGEAQPDPALGLLPADAVIGDIAQLPAALDSLPPILHF